MTGLGWRWIWLGHLRQYKQRNKHLLSGMAAALPHNVNYSSNVLQGAVNARVMLLREKKITPYISGKAGCSFTVQFLLKTRMMQAVVTRLIRRTSSRGWNLKYSRGYGGGFIADWSVLIRKQQKEKLHWSESTKCPAGNKVDYINTKIDRYHPPPPAGKRKGTGTECKICQCTTTNEIMPDTPGPEVYTTLHEISRVQVIRVFVLD